MTKALSWLLLCVFLPPVGAPPLRANKGAFRIGWELQCFNTTCPSYTAGRTISFRVCQMECLVQQMCRVASFRQSTSNCQLFDNFPSPSVNLVPNPDMILIVLDDVGEIQELRLTSSASTTTSTTTSATMRTTSEIAISPPGSLGIVLGSVEGLWNTFTGGSSTLATAGTNTGNYLVTDPPNNLFDDNLTTIFSSRGDYNGINSIMVGVNTGFLVTVGQCQPVLTGFRLGHVFTTASREPLLMTIEGTNCADVIACTNWSLLYSGTTGLSTVSTNDSYGDYQAISNTMIYSSYRFLMMSKRTSSAYLSYSEAHLFGYTNYTASGAAGSLSRLSIYANTLESLWDTVLGNRSLRAVAGTSGAGTYPAGQSLSNLFDGDLSTRYLTRGNSTDTTGNTYAGLFTGFFFTLAGCHTTLVQFRLAPGASAGSDPSTVTIEGTKCSSALNCTSWTNLYVGPSGLTGIADRSSFADWRNISNPRAFPAYRFTVVGKTGNTASVNYGEIELRGY